MSSADQPINAATEVARISWREAGKRILALSFIYIAAYFVVGSALFGDWWYGFFWGGQFASPRWVALGWRFLVNWHVSAVTCTVLGASLVIFLSVWSPRRVTAFLNRFVSLIVALSLAAILLSGLAVYLIPGNAEAYASLLGQLPFLDKNYAVSQLRATLQEPEITAPIYFHYLSQERVDQLYNQLEPELQEVSKDVRSATKVSGGAEAGTAGGKLQVGGEQSGEEENKFTRAEFTPEKKCIAVMKYVRATWPANYYTVFDDWLTRYQTQLIIDANRDRGQEIRPRESYGWGPTADFNDRFASDLEEQLRSVRGLIFVDGEFTESLQGDKALLTYDFRVPTTPPSKAASFRVSLPRKQIANLPTHRLRLTIFGDVTKPLGEDGTVDVAPIAIY
jgi:hypothetical protein